MTDKLISELIELPERVRKGDFVLNLSKGVTEPDKTLEQYVVTPQLVACFEDALGFIKSAVEAVSSKACYLHGSFGAGKSHFMAVLHLLLEHNAADRTARRRSPRPSPGPSLRPSGRAAGLMS
jgi:chromosomal replication initiation ATPase DnaA